MEPASPTPIAIASFITHWAPAQSAERTNAQPFLLALTDLLHLPRPDPAINGDGPYRFERSVTHRDAEDRATTRRIDLYKRGCFILEAKQGANPDQRELFAAITEQTRRQMVRNSKGWGEHMLRAKGQAEGYVRDLPADEPAPPFLIVCDVGFCFDIYADFSGTGRHYAQYPDRQQFRIYLTDLHTEAARKTLTTIWTDPLKLDPARKRAEVTSQIAAFLAELAKTLERRESQSDVAFFLIRCIFCMFAQSVGLLPKGDFTSLLQRCAAKPASFVPLLADLWRAMNTGGYSIALETNIARFNGGFFAQGREPLKLGPDEINLLVSAAGRDWANVEPAIFGTLLESALDAKERGQLGAHFTPRAFVERLVLPTVMAPLRLEWDSFKAASGKKLEAGDRPAAAAELRAFHHRLCTTRVLDPACGSGNFLYVTMELMKRLEGEVLDALANLQLGEGDRLDLPGESVTPKQFFGLEKNPRAVPVAELVLWIGHLQWHFRTRTETPPPEPILHDYRTITKDDALLTYTREEELRDKNGVPIMRWDQHTLKRHPITGEMVPDSQARQRVMRPVNARMTQWPPAEFIVGNPPFIAGKDMRTELGDGYALELWQVYKLVPESADIALFFWWRAAETLAAKTSPLRRFGFITSNSIRQIFCRSVVTKAMIGERRLRLVYGIPDHPWSDGKGTAAVRISMTVAELASQAGADPAILEFVTRESAVKNGAPDVVLTAAFGTINADLTIGTDTDRVKPLEANEGLSSRGVSLHGAGFIVTPHMASSLGLGRLPGIERHIRPYLNGRDLTQRSRGVMVIDLFGLTETELRRQQPSLYQHVASHVKPERDQNARKTYRDNWWIFGEPRVELRAALAGLPRYIATVETAKHRVFCFIPDSVLPDNKLVCIATADAFHLGVLSSRLHVQWALAAGGWLGVGNDPVYIKTRCFDPFPFPAATNAQRAEIGSFAEELDRLRRTAIDNNRQITMTGLYNVLEALRQSRPLTPTERDIHDAGHVTILRHLHDRLDAEVAAAYGWPATLTPPQIVERIVALNIARRAEEQKGYIQWLRPDFQTRRAQRAIQGKMDVVEASLTQLPPWPTGDQKRAYALRASLAAAPGNPKQVASRFAKAKIQQITEMLETLVNFGQAHRTQEGEYRI